MSRAARWRTAVLLAALWAGGPGWAMASGEPAAEGPVAGRGFASWYGSAFHGRRTASGERFDMHALTAAHPSLPFGTVLEVRSLANGRTVRVRINDRGPFSGRRIIDLSRAAAQAIGLVGRGHKRVELRVVSAPAERPADAAASAAAGLQRLALPPSAAEDLE